MTRWNCSRFAITRAEPGSDASAPGTADSGGGRTLQRWANREITTKDEAVAALSELTAAVRAGTFDPRDLQPSTPTVLTFEAFADRNWERHAKGLRGADTVKTRLDIVAGYFGHRAVQDLKPADLDDLFTSLGQPTRLAKHQKADRVRATATINRFRSL